MPSASLPQPHIDPGPDAATVVDPRWHSTARVLGVPALERLQRSAVAVVGIGGVGSWTAEALVRSGVGRVVLIDGDEVCISNTNRQLHALTGHYGRLKVEVLADRLKAIAPSAQIEPIARFLTPSSLDLLERLDVDLVLDATDAFRVKCELIAWCKRTKRAVVTCGAAAGRIDPTRVAVRDLSRTEHDALLSLIRKKLRQDFGFARNLKRSFGVPAVFSLENVRPPDPSCAALGDGIRRDCDGALGAMVTVTASFGMVAASVAIERLRAVRDDPAE